MFHASVEQNYSEKQKQLIALVISHASSMMY